MAAAAETGVPPAAPEALPFSGIRVLEVAEWVFVPAAAALLADWGAEVVKVERLTGDPYRGLSTQGIGTLAGDVNVSVQLANRGKRSISLDITHPQGRALLGRLIGSSDVFMTNLRAPALKRLHLDPAGVRADNENIIYARGHGFGERGPDRDAAGFDSTAFWARGGMAYVHSAPEYGYPVSQRGAFGDRLGSMNLAFGVAAALSKRDRSGQPSIVDVSLLATALYTLSSDVLSALQGGKPRPRTDRTDRQNPLVNDFRTSDGRYVQLVLLQADRFWPELCAVIQRPDLRDDPRFRDAKARAQHRAECLAELDATFATRPFAEWCRLLSAADFAWAPVQSVEECLADPQVRANHYVAEVEHPSGSFPLPTGPVHLDERPPTLHRAPEHGEHTEQVLLELGLTWDDIGLLQQKSVIL